MLWIFSFFSSFYGGCEYVYVYSYVCVRVCVYVVCICRPEFNIRYLYQLFFWLIIIFLLISLRILYNVFWLDSSASPKLFPTPPLPSYPPNFIFSFTFKRKENKQTKPWSPVCVGWLLLGYGPALFSGVWLIQLSSYFSETGSPTT